MKPCIFLDIDGVMHLPGDAFGQFNQEAVKHLNWLTHAADAQIVVSSTWRLMPDISLKLMEQGVLARMIGKTPDLGNKTRGEEIEAWFRTRARRRFVILDDDTDMAPFTSQLVQTDPLVGLTAPLAELALEILCRTSTRAHA
ncbi:MAG TPA: HAD domain-containing protein [Gemmatimonadales bacterium]|nr:HAD domain-containing protein [Gemmatimonadales bacterium]